MAKASRKVAAPDDDAIPQFLRLTAAQRADAWKRTPPKAFVFIEPKPALDPRAAEAIAAIETGKEQQRRFKQEQKRLKANARDALPADFNLIDYRWDPAKGRFVRDDIGARMWRAERGLVVDIKPNAKPEGKKKAPAVADSGIASQLATYTHSALGIDLVKLKKFAKANGVWQDKYDDLPNNGLRRMNVLNRLRGKINKDAGYKVVWP